MPAINLLSSTGFAIASNSRQVKSMSGSIILSTTKVLPTKPNAESYSLSGHTLLEILLICITTGILSIVTIVGNILVFIAFRCDKKLQTITNYFILSLAASDVLIGVFSINFYATYLILGEWPLGLIVCDAWLSVDYLCCQASVLNLVTICVDRYLSLTKPFQHRATQTGYRAKIVIATVWVISFIVWVPWILGYQFIQGERTVPKGQCYIQFLTENAYITSGTSILAFYVPVTIMSILYGRIYILVRERQKQLNLLTNCNLCQKDRIKVEYLELQFPPDSTTAKMVETISDGEVTRIYQASQQNGLRESPINFDTPDYTGKENRQSRLMMFIKHRKAARMLAAILLAYFITWLPYHIFTLMQPFCPTCIPNELWSFGYWFYYVNSTVNPFCYAFANKDFRKTFRQLLRCNRSRKPFCSNGDRKELEGELPVCKVFRMNLP